MRLSPTCIDTAQNLTNVILPDGLLIKNQNTIKFGNGKNAWKDLQPFPPLSSEITRNQNQELTIDLDAIENLTPEQQQEILITTERKIPVSGPLTLYVSKQGTDSILNQEKLHLGKATTEDTAFLTIDAAIKYAHEYIDCIDTITIHVGEGTYNEQITIYKQSSADFVLEGSGKNKTIIQPNPSNTDTFTIVSIFNTRMSIWIKNLSIVADSLPNKTIYLIDNRFNNVLNLENTELKATNCSNFQTLTFVNVFYRSRLFIRNGTEITSEIANYSSSSSKAILAFNIEMFSILSFPGSGSASITGPYYTVMNIQWFSYVYWEKVNKFTLTGTATGYRFWYKFISGIKVPTKAYFLPGSTEPTTDNLGSYAWWGREEVANTAPIL